MPSDFVSISFDERTNATQTAIDALSDFAAFSFDESVNATQMQLIPFLILTAI
jgi:hypothetical protein